MPGNDADTIFQSIKKGLLYAVAVFIFLWLCYKVFSVILLLLFALVLVIILNSPVAWLERKKNLKRGWACAIVFGAIAIGIALLSWLIVPIVGSQLGALANNLPSYATRFSNNVASWFENYPEIQRQIRADGSSFSNWVPSLPKVAVQLGNISVSILGALIILIIFISMVVYAVVNPRPLLEIYFSFFSAAKRIKAERALLHTGDMLSGWMRANLIGGAIEFVFVTSFLTIMKVPGAWVWGALALFAQLIPRIGFYIMSIPPLLVALSISPFTALWVLIFFLALDEVLGDFVMPRLRSTTMNVHPVSTIFLLLAMGSAFGLVGALLATPLAAIIKAYYEEFYLSDVKQDKQTEKRIDEVMYRTGSESRIQRKNKPTNT
jgi:putative permease